MKLLIYKDYPEDAFTSSQVYADNLSLKLKEQNANLKIYQCLPLASLSKKLGYFNLKTRFLFRYFIYPLLAPFFQKDVNHIVDQTYAHLLYFIDGRKTVITVHDLDVLRLKFLKWPTLRDKLIKYFYIFSVRAIKRAGKIIAVSQDTKNDVVKFLKIPEEKIVVIPEGMDSVFQRIKDKKVLLKVKKKYKLPEKFILHVGENWQNKNMGGILKIFKKLSQKKESKDLFFVKVNGKWTDDQKKLIDKLNIEKKIVKVPFVSSRDLAAIYNQASALIQLSFLEGFGLTVLEAMACGCPVVVSNTPALKELVADCGIIVDPKDEKEVISKLKELIISKKMQSFYSQNGLRRSKGYSWEKAARETFNIYEEIISQKV